MSGWGVQGEKAFAESVSSTAIGARLAEMKLQAEALSGISKIAYVPHLPGLLQKNNVVLSNSTAMPGFDGEDPQLQFDGNATVRGSTGLGL